MAPSITSEKLTLSCPLFGASFIDSNRLLVAGGGGEGRNGVGNRIFLVDTCTGPGRPLKATSEVDLSKEEDAVMSLAALRSSLRIRALAGINSSSKASANEHFRIFNIPTDDHHDDDDKGKISLVSKHSLFSAPDPETYQRVVRVDDAGELAVIASGSGLAPTSASEIVVLDVFPSPSVRRRMRLPGKEEAGDVDISGDGKRVSFCTSGEIYTASTSKREKVGWGEYKSIPLKWKTSTRPKGSFRSIRYTDEGRIIAVFNLFGRSGAIVFHIDPSGEFLASRKLHNGIRAVTGMDSISLSPSSSLVAVAGADQSVELMLVDGGIKSVKMFKKAHPFQITKLSFSPLPASAGAGEIKLATTSVGNTVLVFSIPVLAAGKKDGWILRQTSMKQTALWVVISLIGVVTFAVALQIIFNAQAGLLGEGSRNGGAADRAERRGVEEITKVTGRVVIDGARQVGAGVVNGVLREAVQGVVG